MILLLSATAGCNILCQEFPSASFMYLASSVEKEAGLNLKIVSLCLSTALFCQIASQVTHHLFDTHYSLMLYIADSTRYEGWAI